MPLNSLLRNFLLIKKSNSSQFLEGEQIYTTPGTYSWTAPAGVTSVHVVCIGAGGGASGVHAKYGGGGGGLGWKNNIQVIPGNTYTVVVGNQGEGGQGLDGGTSYFINTSTVSGGGGGGGNSSNGAAGIFVGDGGAIGGRGGRIYETSGGGGGGAGGYISGSLESGTGEDNYTANKQGRGGAGAGGGSGFGGGGVGIYGNVYNGLNVSTGGSGGTDGTSAGGGSYGGGGTGNQRYAPTNGGGGAVRILWNSNRFYPWTANISSYCQVEYLVVAGGGGGGSDFGGGGGAGGLNTGIFFALKTYAYNIVIGGGGSRGPSQGTSGYAGNYSQFATQVVYGGGGGGSYSTGNGGSGGSGGGGGGPGASGGAGNPTVSFGAGGSFPIGISNFIASSDSGVYFHLGTYATVNIPLGQEIFYNNQSYGKIKFSFPNWTNINNPPNTYILDTSTNFITGLITMTCKWTNTIPGSQTSVQGFNGGSSAGGGGGATSIGVSGEGGRGGTAFASNISGTKKLYGGGGGGGAGGGGTLNNGGSGIGGSGAGYSGISTGVPTLSTSGLISTGSGGGGGAATGGNVSLGANGSGGIVILKYPKTINASFTGGLGVSTITLGDFKISSITSGTGKVTFT